MSKETKRVNISKQYSGYYKAMRAAGKQPMTKFHWEKSGRKGVYYGSKTSQKAQLSRSDRKAIGMKD